MVCPHCKSTDIITVQNEHFCISCGRALSETEMLASMAKVAAKPKPKPVEQIMTAITEPVAVTAAPVTPVAALPAIVPAVTVASSEPRVTAHKAPKRRKPGRPKAGRLDVAAEPRVAITPIPAAQAHIHRGHPSHRRRLSDLAPAVGTTTGVTTTTATVSPPEPVRSDTTSMTAGITAAALAEQFRPANFAWAIMPAALLALVVGATTWVLFGPRAAEAWNLTLQAGWPLWGELIGIAALYYVSHNLAAAAIAYGATRRADHRPTPAQHQLAAAVNSHWRRVALDVCALALQLVTLASIGALVMMGGTAWPMAITVQTVTLFIGFLGLLYLWVGLILAGSLGRVAVTLGSVSVGRGLALGWRFFAHHFELVGMRAVALVVEAVLLAPLVATVVILGVFLPADLRWLAAIVAVLLTVVGGALLGAGTAVWWQAAYSRLVRGTRPAESNRLLAGRPAAPAHRGALVATAILGGLLASLTIAWPWLPFF